MHARCSTFGITLTLRLTTSHQVRILFEIVMIVIKRAQMGKGICIGKWGQLKGRLLYTFAGTSEWKIDMGFSASTYRYLSPSHIYVPLYLGYAIAPYNLALHGGLIVADVPQPGFTS